MSDIRCVLIKIHGIGKQKADWDEEFDLELEKRLETLPEEQQERFESHSVWWANLSQLPGMQQIAFAAAGSPSGPMDSTFAQVQQGYILHLAASDGAPMGTAEPFLGLGFDIFARLKDILVRGIDCANDVANYVTNNGVRLAIQRCLSDKLFELQEKYPEASLILGSHSQGTIIAYDVLRLDGFALPRLHTWVTMGCPLGWYLTCLNWGRDILGIQPGTKWVNLYDREDKVGTTLAGLLSWNSPAPQDIDVDNTAKGLDAHDHWHNPEVVDQYFQLIRTYIS